MQREIRAVAFAIACSVIGAVTKFVVGSMTGSMSMISSAVDSLGDLFVSAANMLVLRVASRGPDEDHNYGHAKIEGLGAMFEGGFICAAGCFIIYEAVHKALVGETNQEPLLGILVMLPLTALTIGLVLYMRKVARETGSLVIKSDALHYSVDVWVNLGVLLSLVLVKLTGEPLIDSAISVALALYLIYSSTHIVREGLDVLMDHSLDAEVATKLRDMLAAYPKILSFHDFKTRGGKLPLVDFHVLVDPRMTTREAHDLFIELQEKVRVIVGPTTKLLMHVDPAPDAPTLRAVAAQSSPEVTPAQ